MSCSRCSRSPCTCGGLPATPQPFYIGAPACAEDHSQKIYYNQFSFGLEIPSSWNIPQCGGSAIFTIPGASIVPIGASIWNSTYGYFTIIGFDSGTQQVTIENPCLSGNAPVGTQVPECTTFVVTPPSCCEDTSQTGTFVKIDFTAPAVDDCSDITLTSVDNLTAGGKIQIGNGVYLLSEVKVNNVVTICNQGEGIAAGTSVIAQNISGQYQYPVIYISVNPCTQDLKTDGIVLVCNSGSAYPLNGTATGQFLALTDSITGDAAYSSITVTDVEDLQAAAATVATQIGEIISDIGTINTEITTLQNDLGTLFSTVASAVAAPFSQTLNSGNTTFTSNPADISITNSSATRTMHVHYTVVSRIFGNTNNANTDQLEMIFDLQTNINGGGVTSVANMNEVFFTKTDGTEAMDRQRVWHGVATIAPTVTWTLSAHTICTWVSSGASEYIVDNCDTSITALGVSI